MVYNVAILTHAASICFFRQLLFIKYFTIKIRVTALFIIGSATITVYICIQQLSQNIHLL
ncbi:MAG: hypothetical protein JWQ57_4643 [Mucilaginibacter sp.]|nr:hypothetical protein [Mucilaginibacter sp.]